MCAIISWTGKLPKGLLSKLMTESEARGHDSTGLAFRSSGKNYGYRQAVSAKVFVNENNKNMSEARRSTRGIGHTRRASPNMPIDNANAHPYSFWKYFYAHNGRINNWEDIKKLLIEHYENELKEMQRINDQEGIKAAAYYKKYAENCTTDSMVLGPYIESRDFSSIVGCMALVWMRGDHVYTFRYAKEAVAALIKWKYKEPVDNEAVEEHKLVVVASTRQIVDQAINKLDKLEYSIEYNEFPEDHVYLLNENAPGGLLDEGTIPVNVAVEDKFSSETVGESSPAAADATAISDGVNPPPKLNQTPSADPAETAGAGEIAS
jgi:predicted glutamine amidotransferase